MTLVLHLCFKGGGRVKAGVGFAHEYPAKSSKSARSLLRQTFSCDLHRLGDRLVDLNLAYAKCNSRDLNINIGGLLLRGLNTYLFYAELDGSIFSWN